MTCSFDECTNQARKAGLCYGHYQQRRKGQDLRPLRHRSPNGQGTNGDGYPTITVGGRRMLTHRWVMEQHLGRRLRDDETVHHKNLDRADYRIENLELWSGRHPKGARVVDLLEWAREIVDLYGDESEILP